MKSLTDKQTHKRQVKHNLFGEGITHGVSYKNTRNRLCREA